MVAFYIVLTVTDKKFRIGAFLDSKNGKWRWGNGIKTTDSFEVKFPLL
jgi:hypothetical protein